MNAVIPSQDDSLDPRAFTDDEHRILAILALTQNGDPNTWLSAAIISRLLRDEHGIHIHWRTIDSVLAKDPKWVAKRRRGGRSEYKLLQDGRAQVELTGSSIILVDPANAIQATASLHTLLEGLQGEIRICDPYLDTATIEHLDACPRDTPILFLTNNIRDTGGLRRMLAAAQAANINVEIRQTSGASLHDRYIMDLKSMVILGTSLNGFGKKQCFVVHVGPDMRATMLQAFDAQWQKGNPWP